MKEFCAKPSPERMLRVFPHLHEWPGRVEHWQFRPSDARFTAEFFSPRLSCVYFDFRRRCSGTVQIYINGEQQWPTEMSDRVLYYTHPAYFRKYRPKQKLSTLKFLERIGMGLFSVSKHPLRPRHGYRKNAHVRVEFSFHKDVPQELDVYVQEEPLPGPVEEKFEDDFYFWHLYMLDPYFCDPYGDNKYKTRKQLVQEIDEDVIFYQYNYPTESERLENSEAEYDKYGS
jgi:hypothetical protein